MEDLGEMKGDDFVTSGEDSSDNEDLFETMVDADMLGRDETAQKANTDPEARKKKDVAKLLGAMRTIRKADEMWARWVAVLEEIVGRYPDLAGLAEIVKPAKTVMDQTPVPTAHHHNQQCPRKFPLLVISGTQKLYPSSAINTLGIRIFKCPVM